MRRTIKIKISVPVGFQACLEAGAEVFNLHVDWCFTNKTYNKSKAHKDLYQKIKLLYPDFNTCLIQTIRDSALEAVKAVKFKFKPSKKPGSHIRYDQRTASLRGNQLSFAWSGKRFKQIISIPRWFSKKYSQMQFKAATIGYDRQLRSYVACLTFECQDIQTVRNQTAIGIDRGFHNIVFCSDGFRYASNRIRKMRREILFLKKQLQTKGTRSCKRKLKKLSGYEKRFSRDVNHCISKYLVSLPYDTFILEDLAGIRKGKRLGKKLNKWLSNWSFFQLEQFLTYKAVMIGKQVVKINPAFTSIDCSVCDNRDRNSRKRSKFCCTVCGHSDHSDLNAAKNILKQYISTITERHSASSLLVEQAVVEDNQFPIFVENDSSLHINQPNIPDSQG